MMMKSSYPDGGIPKQGGVRSAIFNPGVTIRTEVYQWDLRSFYFRLWSVAKGGTKYGMK